jgi:thiol-disulfide isomerase/thioredoxin
MIRQLTLILVILFIGVSTSTDAQERILSFPMNESIGTLSLFRAPEPSENVPGMLDFSPSLRPLGPAKGEIVVPVHGYIGLEMHAGGDPLGQLGNIPREGISRLTLNGWAVNTSVLEQLENLKSLRQLDLVDCDLLEIDLDSLQGHPRLTKLLCEPKNGNRNNVGGIVRWAAMCPSLQYYYCSSVRDLSNDEIQLFHQHQTPLFLSVSLDERAEETVKCLTGIPKLVGLNLFVSNDATLNFHRLMPRLRELSWINWSGGNLDLDTLQSLMQMPALRTVRFQRNATPTDEFLSHLPDWKDVHSIAFNSPLPGDQAKLFRDSLNQMESLRIIEGLKNPTAEQLRRLASRNDLRAIEIYGLSDKKDVHLLSNILQENPNLYSISLNGLEVDEGLAEAICRCANLEYLTLSVDDFDGANFLKAEALDQLSSVDLSASKKVRNLSVLSRFPGINRLSISTATHDPNIWSFIADMPTLQHFTIQDGYSNDRIVKWLNRCNSLQHFNAGQDALFTEVGIDELSDMAQLQSLTISGFLSPESIKRLAKLPSLTWLSIASDRVPDEAKGALEDAFSGLSYFRLRTLNPSAGPIVVDDNNFFRSTTGDGRTEWDAMEGKSTSEFFGAGFTPELESYMKGKVVLVDFWGTWCGPCLGFHPEIERLRERYDAEGFVVVGVHSEMGKADVDSFLEKNPKAWLNVIDEDGTIADRFKVARWPSLFLIGRDGTVRVAQAHRLGLGSSIEKLLDETR